MATHNNNFYNKLFNHSTAANAVLSANDDSGIFTTIEASSVASNTVAVDGNLTVDGLSVTERLEIIELILGLPVRDAEMEQKHPYLKELHEQHVERCKLVKDSTDKYTEELEKLRTFEKLKKDY